MNKEQQTILAIQKVVGEKDYYSYEDVFKALKVRKRDNSEFPDRVLMAITEEGEFMEWLSGWEEIGIYYDIDKPYHLQSKETKDLIGDLILK